MRGFTKGTFMTNRERERYTLDFKSPGDRGSVEETFFPWNITLERFISEGVPADIMESEYESPYPMAERYIRIGWGKGILNYEKYFGFDAVRRIGVMLPFRCIEDEYKELLPQKVECEADWEKLKEYSDRIFEKHFTDEIISALCTPLQSAHKAGEYSIRLNLEGFFWTPRTLFGIEEHLYAFYDYPELMHDMCSYILDAYMKYLPKILKIIPADVVYIMEDLSGKTGPMLSHSMFDEFLGTYYKKLIPMLKACGVGNVFVDTDGDFKTLIPNFIAAGVDGFLPMDVNAGMDIVAVREEFPSLKFIGGYNKLSIAEGKDAIDKEFKRIMPVIKKGGFIPGADHQVAPSTSLENYKYYIEKLKEAMKHCGECVM